MKRENCPCCGYPTLDERIGYEICLLCDWEDGEYSEQNPGKIDGGPNGDYSLEEAQRNFEAHLTMYREKPKNRASVTLEKKRVLIDAYKFLNENNEESETAKWERIVRLERHLISQS